MVIVNRAMAARFWPDVDPIGQTVKAVSMESYWFGGTAPWLTVVGVVGDMRDHGFEDDPRPAMFTLYRQIPQMAVALTAVVRTRPGQASLLMRTARERARSVDPGLAVEVGLLDVRVRALLGERRLVTSILLGFALMALGLASLGIYGLLAFAVAVRTREMAIRAALGAGKTRLVTLVLRGALNVVLWGGIVGAVGVVGLRGVLDALLVDVAASDPMTYVVVAGTLMSVALVAVLLPALRAARMDPLEALRT